MGITVVSSANLTATASKSGAPQSASDSGGGSFADLLTGQIAGQAAGGLPAGMAGLDAGLSSDKKGDGKDDGKTDEDDSSLLGAAGLLAGLFQPTKPPVPVQENHPQEEGITGILSQLQFRGGQASDQITLGGDALEALNATLAGKATGDETANIAVGDQTSGNGQNFASLVAQSTSAQSAQAENQVPQPTTIPTPLHDGGWSHDFGEKMVWLVKNDQQVAQLNINPPQLGPMHITLNINGDQASALFVSPHAEVRQAIEDAMPHLREVLAGAGINLGQANVGTQLPQQNNSGQPQFSTSSRSSNDRDILRADDGRGIEVSPVAIRGGRGMVDLFA